MKRYQKLQRRIRAEQEDFLGDVILAAGFKLCDDVSRAPEGQSVYVESFSSADGMNFVLIPCFAVPNYMSVKQDSPTFIERSSQEKEAIRAKMFDALEAEGITSIRAEEAYSNDVKLLVRV